MIHASLTLDPASSSAERRLQPPAARNARIEHDARIEGAPTVGCEPWLCVAAALPDLRVAVTVKTGEDDNVCARHDVENTVGEASKQRASDFAVNLGKSLRVPLDGFKALIERLHELVTKVVTSLPVPIERVADIGLSGVSEPETQFFRFSSSRTCGQVRVAPGSRW